MIVKRRGRDTKQGAKGRRDGKGRNAVMEKEEREK